MGIIEESEATNTVENAVMLRRLLEDGSIRRLVIITSAFHMPRVRLTFEMIFADAGLEMEFVASSDAGLTPAERERENVVEPAMTERLPGHSKVYLRYYSGEISLLEARKAFFQNDTGLP